MDDSIVVPSSNSTQGKQASPGDADAPVASSSSSSAEQPPAAAARGSAALRAEAGAQASQDPPTQVSVKEASSAEALQPTPAADLSQQVSSVQEAGSASAGDQAPSADVEMKEASAPSAPQAAPEAQQSDQNAPAAEPAEQGSDAPPSAAAGGSVAQLDTPTAPEGEKAAASSEVSASKPTEATSASATESIPSAATAAPASAAEASGSAPAPKAPAPTPPRAQHTLYGALAGAPHGGADAQRQRQHALTLSSPSKQQGRPSEADGSKLEWKDGRQNMLTEEEEAEYRLRQDEVFDDGLTVEAVIAQHFKGGAFDRWKRGLIAAAQSDKELLARYSERLERDVEVWFHSLSSDAQVRHARQTGKDRARSVLTDQNEGFYGSEVYARAVEDFYEEALGGRKAISGPLLAAKQASQEGEKGTASTGAAAEKKEPAEDGAPPKPDVEMADAKADTAEGEGKEKEPVRPPWLAQGGRWRLRLEQDMRNIVRQLRYEIGEKRKAEALEAAEENAETAKGAAAAEAVPGETEESSDSSESQHAPPPAAAARTSRAKTPEANAHHRHKRSPTERHGGGSNSKQSHHSPSSHLHDKKPSVSHLHDHYHGGHAAATPPAAAAATGASSSRLVSKTTPFGNRPLHAPPPAPFGESNKIKPMVVRREGDQAGSASSGSSSARRGTGLPQPLGSSTWGAGRGGAPGASRGGAPQPLGRDTGAPQPLGGTPTRGSYGGYPQTRPPTMRDSMRKRP